MTEWSHRWTGALHILDHLGSDKPPSFPARLTPMSLSLYCKKVQRRNDVHIKHKILLLPALPCLMTLLRAPGCKQLVLGNGYFSSLSANKLVSAQP